MDKSHLLQNNPARQQYRYTSVPCGSMYNILHILVYKYCFVVWLQTYLFYSEDLNKQNFALTYVAKVSYVYEKACVLEAGSTQ